MEAKTTIGHIMMIVGLCAMMSVSGSVFVTSVAIIVTIIGAVLADGFQKKERNG